MSTILNPQLERRLRRDVQGDVLFSSADRGRYATDASIYQMMPTGVVVPKHFDDVLASLDAAREAGISILSRGGGTSQCGQTVNSGLVVDNSKHLNRILELDVEGRRCIVEPGIVLDELNRALKPHGLWFPVDVSTASRATIGGMAGNNSCGGKSIRFGTMRDNVIAIEAVLADGSERRFSSLSQDASTRPDDAVTRELLAIGAREAEEIEARFPKVQRRVGGYNLDALVPALAPQNLSHILVGSEGTLACFKTIELKLSPVVGNKVMGICHFPSFYAAMDAAQHLAKLAPLSVELVDATMIGLARDIAMFRPTIEAVVRGAPAALLLVEFDEGDAHKNQEKLAELDQLMGDLGFVWNGGIENVGGAVPVLDAATQKTLEDQESSREQLELIKAETMYPGMTVSKHQAVTCPNPSHRISQEPQGLALAPRRRRAAGRPQAAAARWHAPLLRARCCGRSAGLRRGARSASTST